MRRLVLVVLLAGCAVPPPPPVPENAKVFSALHEAAGLLELRSKGCTTADAPLKERLVAAQELTSADVAPALVQLRARARRVSADGAPVADAEQLRLELHAAGAALGLAHDAREHAAFRDCPAR